MINLNKKNIINVLFILLIFYFILNLIGGERGLISLIDKNYQLEELMLKNGWINPMHTEVPGPDGQLSYGGYCFPKDTNALLQHMIKEDTPNKVLEATINERNEMRKDNTNVKL